MVYYYSGTGNSAYVARELARMTGQKRPPRSIPEVMKAGYILRQSFGFCISHLFMGRTTYGSEVREASAGSIV